MFQPVHCGLYFSSENIGVAKRHKGRAPFKDAWRALDDMAPDAVLDTLVVEGLRRRFHENDADPRVERAAQLLRADLIPTVDDHTPIIASIMETLALAQCFELLHDHPATNAQIRSDWRAAFDTFCAGLTSRLEDDADIVDRLWMTALTVVAGIILDDEARFLRGAADFRQAVDTAIHPEGYLPGAVENAPETESLENQLLCVAALTLTAEAAHHCGVDLWSHNKRGVSILTAGTYPLYYYFYPEKWPWNGDQWKPSDGVDAEVAERMFKRYSGMIEIINLRYGRPLKALELITADLRPIFDVYAGGLTTLTHGVAQRRGIFG